jgi:hypothetical protein
VSEQRELMQAWNKRWGQRGSITSVPVSYCPNPEEEDPEFRDVNITTAYGLAFMGQPKDGSEMVAKVRLTDYGPHLGGARLDHLTVLENVIAKLSEMPKVTGDEAIQRYPECPECGVEMNWDEGFDCPVCHTHFSDNCEFDHKVCVEYDCSEQADLVGPDGQPRCTTCSVLVLCGTQEPFSPYNCVRCNSKVTGIPARSEAAKNQLCGRDQAAKEHRDFIDDIMSRPR